MTARLTLRGTDLRYVVTDHLFRHGPQNIPDLIEQLDYYGFAVQDPASKRVSDALRSELRHGRLRRLRRGRYGPAAMPRSTEHRIYTRAMALRAKADLLTKDDDERFWDQLAALPD